MLVVPVAFLLQAHLHLLQIARVVALVTQLYRLLGVSGVRATRHLAA